MNKKIASYLFIILIIVGVLGYFFLKREKYDPNTPIVSDGQPGSPTFPIIPDQEYLPPPQIVPEESINPKILPKPTYTSHFVNIESSKYDKSPLTVKVGDSVVWTNKDSVPHTVTGSKGGLESFLIEPGKSYKYTFTTEGTFAYKCAMHPSMTGEVIVTK